MPLGRSWDGWSTSGPGAFASICARIWRPPATPVRAMLRALHKGEAIGILPDQVPGIGEGEWTEFFGRPAYTMTLVTRFAQNTGAPVLFVYAERMPRGRGYRL